MSYSNSNIDTYAPCCLCILTALCTQSHVYSDIKPPPVNEVTTNTRYIMRSIVYSIKMAYFVSRRCGAWEWVDKRKEPLLFFEQGDRSMLGFAVICYDSCAPVQQSFNAQSDLCPFVFISTFIGVAAAGRLDECRNVTVAQLVGIRRRLL